MKDFEAKLKVLLNKDLPGIDAWNKMMPGLHPLKDDYSTKGMIESAVLIAFYQEDGKWYFPLIQRVEDGYAHSGQVSFPGGRLDDGESLQECSLREAFEEIGIPVDFPRIIGRLSTFPIHVSNYIVHPFVAIMESKPSWIPQPNEVAEVLEIDLNEICDSNIKVEKWELPNRGLSPVPFYHLQGKKVWGATAMILSELQDILNSDQ